MRGRKKSEATRLAILQCASAVFSERPYHEVLTEHISSRLRVGKGTLYRYFGSKEDLYFAAIVHGLEGMREAIADVMARDLPFEAAVETLTRTVIGYFWERRDFFVLLHRHEPKLDPSERAEWQRDREAVVDLVAHRLRRELQRRGGPRRDPRLAVEMLFGMIRAVCMYRSETDRIDDLVRQVSDVFLGGVLSDRGRRAPEAESLPLQKSPPQRRRATLAMLLFAASINLLSACAGGNETGPAQAGVTPEQAAVPVVVAPVTVQRTERLLRFVGTLFGEEEVTLSALVEGQIKALRVDLGDPIEEGQILAEIHDDRLRAQLREMEANVAKARAEEARGRQLIGKQVISPQEFEAMQTAVAVAEAQRESLNVLITNAQVRSPIAGSVAKRLASVGEFVRPGSPLFELVADERLKLRGDVPERFAQEVQVGQLVQIRVDAHADAMFAGRLTRVSPAANRENRSLTVEAIVQNHDRRLKPGYFANASIVTRIDDQALMVPETAVVKFAGVTKVFIVRDNVAHQREVRTGTRGGAGLIEIEEGVQADDVVVTSGLSRLEDQMPVTIKPVS